MQITPIDTDYNIAGAHSGVLVSLSDFTQAFEDYFIKSLIPQYCHSEAETIVFWESLIRRLGTQTE